MWRRFCEAELCVVLAIELEQVVDGRRTDICADDFYVPVHSCSIIEARSSIEWGWELHPHLRQEE